MSRIGRAPITVPAGVTVDILNNEITVKGPLGTLKQAYDQSITVALDNGQIVVSRHADDKKHRALHGLTRALINNMVTGVTKGFAKTLVVNGVGYKCTLNGNKKLTLNIGFSHPVEVEAIDGVTFELPAPLEIVVKGCDRCLVGQQAAVIKAIKPVEPYHNYGIHYKDETVVKKEGKKNGK